MKMLVIASHSAGHILPAVAFCETFTKYYPRCQIVFVSTQGVLEQRLIGDRFQRELFKKIRVHIVNLPALLSEFRRADRLVDHVTPQCVAAFGGYVSIPFVLSARKKKIPAFIHEQNRRLGKANRVLSCLSPHVCVSFPDTKNVFGRPRVHVVGMPIRSRLRRLPRQEAKKYFGLQPDRFTISILGGSQGSSKINTAAIGAFSKRSDGMQLIHISGMRDHQRVRDAYARGGDSHRVFDYCDEMEYVLSASDLVVSRAGAGTLAELATFQVPAILIPYPHAGNHQSENAQFFVQRDAATVIPDAACSPETLTHAIYALREDSAKRARMSAALSAFDMRQASERLVSFVKNELLQ